MESSSECIETLTNFHNYFQMNFDGFNSGGCSYGGFVLQQFVADNSSYKRVNHGPYCDLHTPNQPLIR